MEIDRIAYARSLCRETLESVLDPACPEVDELGRDRQERMRQALAEFERILKG